MTQRKRLAAIFVSFTILGVGTTSLLQCGSIDYYSVLDTLGKIIPASVVMGGLGWVMGMVLDKPKTKSSGSINYNNIMNKFDESELDIPADDSDLGDGNES